MNQKNVFLRLLVAGCLSGCAGGGGPGPFEGDFGASRELSVEVESLSGTVQGEVLEPEFATLVNYGEMNSGNSAHFEMHSEEFALPLLDDVQEEPELTVRVNVCPIDALAGQGRMIGDLADVASLEVCRDGWCRFAFGESLEIEVIDALEGRRVLAHTLWEGGDEVTVQLRYTEVAEEVSDPS